MRYIQRPVGGRSRQRESILQRSPLLFGYLVALGAIGAVATGLMLYGLRSIIFSVFLAMFATVGLDPLIRWFQRRGMSRAWAIVTVILIVVSVLVGFILVVVPLVVQQISFLATAIPKEIASLRAEGWFDAVNAGSNGVAGQVVAWIGQQAQSRPVAIMNPASGKRQRESRCTSVRCRIAWTIVTPSRNGRNHR